MKTVLKSLLVVALLLGLAAPALADFSLNGYYRLQGHYWDDGGDGDDNQYFVQRLRMKMTNTLNENVSFVYYGEVDTDWGQPDKLDGNGGQVAADGVNLESKNVYLAIKNDTFNTKLGIQGMGDTFDGLIFSDDFAGITFNTKLGAADLGLLYSKNYESDKDVDDDDVDLYGATLAFNPSNTVKLGLSAYYYDAQDISLFDEEFEGDFTALYYGVNAAVALADNLKLSAFLLLTDQDFDGTAGEEDIDESGSTWIANADIKYTMDAGYVKFRALYAPDCDEEDVFIDVAETGLNGENLMFLGGDAFATNNGAGEDQYTMGLYSEYGLTALILSGQYNFSNGFYAAYGLGYMDTDEDDIGTEVALRVGKKVFGNVDLSVRAASFAPGDAYGDNDDNQTKVIGMVNVGF